MIFAKVDVKLRDHERAHRAGSAMSTWLWGLLYAREQETDGTIPDIALRLAWAGEKDARRHAVRLVEVGLWEDYDGGWRICRYESKNETKESIAARRKETRERVAAHRRGVTRYQGVTNANVATAESVLVPGSGSLSGSDLQGGAGGKRCVRSDEPLTDQRRKDFESLTFMAAPRDIVAEWSLYRDDRIKRGMLLHGDAGIDADWRTWIKRGNTFAATKGPQPTGGASARARKELT